MHTVIEPYGSVLIDLMADSASPAVTSLNAKKLPSISLDPLQQSDLELLIAGAYSPLDGYMGESDYLSVLNQMRLSDGRVWAIPLTLPIPVRLAQKLKIGQIISLRDLSDKVIAVLKVAEIFKANDELENMHLGATLDFTSEAKWYVAGAVTGLTNPIRHDFTELRRTPSQLRAYIKDRGWGRIVAYQSSQPLHRAAFEFISRVAIQNQAALLIQPMVGGYGPDRPEYYPLIRGYQAVMSRLPRLTNALSLSPNYPRRGGVREVLHRAIIMRNYGCSHLVVGGEASGEGRLRRGSDVCDDQSYQLVSKHIEGIGVALIPFPRMVYVEERGQFLPLEEAPKDTFKHMLGSDEVKRRLRAGLAMPDWYAFPEVMAEMRIANPPNYLSGYVIVLAGLTGVGKSTVACALSQTLMAYANRKVTVLDHDLLMDYPSMKSDPAIVGYVAAQIIKNNGIAICIAHSDSSAMRRATRKAAQGHGGYLEFYLTASAAARTERTDRVSDIDTFDVPDQPDMTLDTSMLSVSQVIQAMVLKLEQEGYLK